MSNCTDSYSLFEISNEGWSLDIEVLSAGCNYSNAWLRLLPERNDYDGVYLELCSFAHKADNFRCYENFVAQESFIFPVASMT